MMLKCFHNFKFLSRRNTSKNSTMFCRYLTIFFRQRCPFSPSHHFFKGRNKSDLFCDRSGHFPTVSCQNFYLYAQTFALLHCLTCRWTNGIFIRNHATKGQVTFFRTRSIFSIFIEMLNSNSQQSSTYFSLFLFPHKRTFFLISTYITQSKNFFRGSANNQSYLSFFLYHNTVPTFGRIKWNFMQSFACI